MGESGADTAAVEIYDMPFPAAGEDHALVEGVDVLWVEEAGTPEQIEGKALSGEMTPQVSAVGIADAEFLDQGRIAYAALSEIEARFPVFLELPLIKSSRLLQHGCSRVGGGRVALLEVGEAFTEGEALEQLDEADQIAALPAAVAVEEILAGVDIERRAGFLVQGTESHELAARAGGLTSPVLLAQIVEQGKALFELLEIHGAVWAFGENQATLLVSLDECALWTLRKLQKDAQYVETISAGFLLWRSEALFSGIFSCEML